MKLQVEQAIKQIGEPFGFSFTVNGVVLGDVEAFPWKNHDVTVEGTYVYDGGRLIVAGTIKTRGIYACTRCLTAVERNGRIPFIERYETGFHEDDDALVCDGVTIDISDVIRQILITNEPVQVLCQEDCKGLCPQCGANLNDSSCGCDTFVTDPRLAVLHTLLKPDD